MALGCAVLRGAIRWRLRVRCRLTESSSGRRRPRRLRRIRRRAESVRGWCVLPLVERAWFHAEHGHELGASRIRALSEKPSDEEEPYEGEDGEADENSSVEDIALDDPDDSSDEGADSRQERAATEPSARSRLEAERELHAPFLVEHEYRLDRDERHEHDVHEATGHVAHAFDRIGVTVEARSVDDDHACGSLGEITQSCLASDHDLEPSGPHPGTVARASQRRTAVTRMPHIGCTVAPNPTQERSTPRR